MAADIINGKEIAEGIRAGVAERVAKLAAASKPIPHLTVIQVGDDPSSTVYVRNKAKTTEKLGMLSTMHKLPEETTQAELIALIHSLNEDKSVTGVLVQLPLPKHINPDAVIIELDPAKDVDCLQPINIGRLWSGSPFVKPCTPFGIMEMLRKQGMSASGKRAVVIGRSNIVGKPVAALLLNENATVTICHSRTVDLPGVASQADILVVAVGRPQFATGDFIKEGAVVIDVGVNRIVDSEGKEHLVGDVDFAAASLKASAITPVPGGVGPMTIAMLMHNTLTCYDYQHPQ